MTEREAAVWAAERWGGEVKTEQHAHPTSIGDQIAILYARNQRGQWFRGIGYSGMAPWGVSMWAKAAADLLRQEPQANLIPKGECSLTENREPCSPDCNLLEVPRG